MSVRTVLSLLLCRFRVIFVVRKEKRCPSVPLFIDSQGFTGIRGVFPGLMTAKIRLIPVDFNWLPVVESRLWGCLNLISSGRLIKIADFIIDFVTYGRVI